MHKTNGYNIKIHLKSGSRIYSNVITILNLALREPASRASQESPLLECLILAIKDKEHLSRLLPLPKDRDIS